MIKKEFFVYVGIALSLTGVPLGMYFNYMFPFIEWSPVFMFISIFLIFSFKNFLMRRFPSFNKNFTLIIISQLLMLLYGSFSQNLTFQYLSFHLYIISFVFALASNEKSISYNKVIKVTFYVSSICTTLGAFFIWNGFVIGDDAWQLRQDNENYALEQFTVAGGAITNLITVLSYKSKKMVIRVLLMLFFILDIYIITSSGKRTPIVVGIIILLIYLYKTGVSNKKMLYNYYKYVISIFILLIIVYLNNNSFVKIIDNFSIYFYNGFLNILGDKSVSDGTGSGIARFQARNWSYNYIENEFNFFNYIFGAGYMTKWIDNPLLQSYLDMGILGIILYVYLVVLFPIKSFFKIKNMLSLFALLLCVYNVMSTYSSGHPYGYIKYVPIVFLAFVLNLKSRKITKCKP